MSEKLDYILTALASEGLLLLVMGSKLAEFGWTSAKTFLLAGIAAAGSAFFKWLIKQINKKIDGYGKDK